MDLTQMTIIRRLFLTDSRTDSHDRTGFFDSSQRQLIHSTTELPIFQHIEKIGYLLCDNSEKRTVLCRFPTSDNEGIPEWIHSTSPVIGTGLLENPKISGAKKTRNKSRE